MILNEKEKNAVAATHGVTPDKVNTVIEPVLKNDVIVELSIVNSSEGLNFAILQPSTKIVSGMGIRFCEDSTKTKKGLQIDEVIEVLTVLGIQYNPEIVEADFRR